MTLGKQKKEQNTDGGLDAVDLRILSLLQQDARMTVREVATEVKLSATPVHERIKRMEKAGVIRQYAAIVDYKKINKALMVICYVSLKDHNKPAGVKFIKTINEMPEVIECYNISGEFDFMLKVVTADMDAYYDFHVNRLSAAENIGHVQSVFVMGTVKDTHRLVH